MTIDPPLTDPPAAAGIPAAPAPAAHDAGDTVSDDVVCITCRYDLRSLRPDAVCPECATPVARSVLHHEMVRTARGVPLSVADPAWLRALRNGCALLLIAAAWKVALYVGLVAGWMDLLGSIPVLPRVGLYILPEVLAYAAVWRLAIAEPTAPRGARPRLRAAIRVALGCTLLMLVVTIVSVFWRAQPGPAVAGSYAGHLLTSAAATGLVLFYLARLGRRGGWKWLARHAVVAAWLSPLLLLSLVPPFGHFRMRDVYYQMNPTPGLGYPEAVVPTVLRLAHPLMWDVDLWGWVPLAAYAGWVVILFVSFFVLFARAAGRARADEAGAGI